MKQASLADITGRMVPEYVPPAQIRTQHSAPREPGTRHGCVHIEAIEELSCPNYPLEKKYPIWNCF